MNNKEINQGYEIKERFVTGRMGVAFAENPAAPSQYVTWNYLAESPSHFFWGHYFSDKRLALQDYEKRVESQVEDYEQRTGKPFPLPLVCLSVEPSTGDIINIKLGQTGYYPSAWNRPGEREYNRETAQFANEKLNISKAQEAAMLHGSMFGWQTKGADPKAYDEHGHPKRIQHEAHGR